MRSCAMRFAVRARSMARRWLVLRLNCRPDLRCRMTVCSYGWPGSAALRLLLLPAFQHLRPALELHAERQAHGGKDFLDLLEGLATEVLGLQHVLLGALHQLANERDVRVLQAIGGANRELQLVHGAEQVVVERLVLGTT